MIPGITDVASGGPVVTPGGPVVSGGPVVIP